MSEVPFGELRALDALFTLEPATAEQVAALLKTTWSRANKLLAYAEKADRVVRVLRGRRGPRGWPSRWCLNNQGVAALCARGVRLGALELVSQPAGRAGRRPKVIGLSRQDLADGTGPGDLAHGPG
jgi:hypothetical protein